MQRKIIAGAALALGLVVIAPAAGAQQAEGTQRGQQQQQKAKQQKAQKSQKQQQAQRGKRDFDVQQHTQRWPEASQKAAQAMVEKYGAPDGVTGMLLVWNDTGPFKRTIVYREAIDHRFPVPHKDVLEQVIDYEVPVEKADDLALYDGSVIIDRTPGELSARCDMEAANILALNLADDIVTERKTVQQARDAYARAIMDMQAGDKPAIASRLMFDLKTGDTDNPDSPHRFSMKEGGAGQR